MSIDERLEQEEQIGEGRRVFHVAPPEKHPAPALSSDQQEALKALDTKVFDTECSPEIRDLIERILTGVEPFEPYAPIPGVHTSAKLNPRQINCILMKAAGFKHTEIGAMFNISPVTVGLATRHPYGQKLLAALMPGAVSQGLGIRKRVRVYADDMLERLYTIGMESKDEAVVARIGFGLLDRAGYGPQSTVKHQHQKAPQASSKVLDRLAAAMDESMEVNQMVGANYSIVSRSTEPERADAGSAEDTSPPRSNGSSPVAGVLSSGEERRSA